jgi:hypothetical protein
MPRDVAAAHCSNQHEPVLWRTWFDYSYCLAPNIKLKGVWVALRKLLNPPAETTSRSFFSPAWAPKARPTS